MKKDLKKVLIFGATSDMAQFLINELLYYKIDVYAVSRRELKLDNECLHKYICDLSDENNINTLFENFSDIKFDSVVNFQGVAISAPVEHLKIEELQRQYHISVFSLVSILKNLKNKLNDNSIIINISSMAAFGIFPFLSPYESAKASADIILGCYEMETGIKTVSVKPGVVGTKFWQSSVDINKENFDNFPDDYAEIGEFLRNNALSNTNKGITADKVSKLVYKIIHQKNPKSSYLIGKDAFFISFLSHFKGRILYSIIKKVLNKRVLRAGKCKKRFF